MPGIVSPGGPSLPSADTLADGHPKKKVRKRLGTQRGTLKIQFSDIIIFLYVLEGFNIIFSSVGLPAMAAEAQDNHSGSLGCVEDGTKGLTCAYIA